MPSFIIVGYVWQILERGAFLTPHLLAAPKRTILNRVKDDENFLFYLKISFHSQSFVLTSTPSFPKR